MICLSYFNNINCLFEIDVYLYFVFFISYTLPVLKHPMAKCQICQSGKIRILSDTIFCENCEIYYSMNDGKQRIKALPIVETKQRTLNLCANCTKKASKNNNIQCRVFKEYLKKLPFCSPCKSLNSLFLKNLFFKNFLLHKKSKKTFGIFTFLALLAISWFSAEKVFYFYLYLVLVTENITGVGVIYFLFLWYHFNRYSFFHPILFILGLKKIFDSREIYFNMPVNLLSSNQIENHLDRLKINTSTEKEPQKSIISQKKRLSSCLDLRHHK